MMVMMTAMMTLMGNDVAIMIMTVVDDGRSGSDGEFGMLVMRCAS